ncbi:TatD family hydrolase [Anaerosacchariphilus polymeriproducens]|uniref:TatD family deoxyribonuclease n=1 Tax=Anaerosacchariphilus polymeriproducens TaxID=1812858 RepID=A0A371AW99_9FIRM|nr:TatD family hydrolase [Anaerosacchariphilus polymeriproducens]RDU23874.1 TatD family deoxyribonuclease [Anaerosacchariphilus polymeriproducens]
MSQLDNIKIFESHAHYDDEAFNEDRDILLSTMEENGVEIIVNAGADLESNKKTINLMKQYPFLYGALGIHPSDISDLNDETFSWLKKQLELEKVVAVGEIGLDYYWDKEKEVREKQKNWFRKQIGLARDMKLPMIIHSRDAAKDTLNIMLEECVDEIGGVVHCFSYSKEIALEYLKLGFYIGIGGVITFSNAKKLKEAVEVIPLTSILLETDSPYLAPVPNRGKRNTSLNIPFIAQEIASIKGVSYEEVVKTTNQNAKRLFCI